MIDYYKILGIGKAASSDDIKKAWRTLAKKYHPDVDPTANALFLSISKAYETLSDPVKRVQYDKGELATAFSLKTKHAAYKVEALIKSGDICDIYRLRLRSPSCKRSIIPSSFFRRARHMGALLESFARSGVDISTPSTSWLWTILTQQLS
mgnify:CR=1 FL=1